MNKYKFTELISEAEPTLYHISKTILKNDFDCADAVQEALFKALQKLGTLREERYFKTWLCRILICECYKIYNARKKTVSYDDYAANVAFESYTENTELYQALMKLDKKYRLAVTLHYAEGFKISEIAKMLKVPEGTIKSRLSKARSKLRQLLDEKEEETNEVGQCFPECS